MDSEFCIDTNCAGGSASSVASSGLSWRGWLLQGLDLAHRDVIVIADTIATIFEQTRQRRMLASLDERMRKDVGLSTADVWSEYHKPFWRR